MFCRIIFAFSIAFLASSCATHQGGTSNYTLIASSEFESLLPEILKGEEYASLIIKRDNGFQASALPAKIHLDGLLLSDIKEGRYVELKVKPGKHTLLLKTNGLGLAPFSHTLEINVASGSVTYYRIHPGWPDGMQLSVSQD